MQEFVTLNLGFQQYKVTKQAQIAFYTYLATIVVIFMMMALSPMSMGMAVLVIVSLLLNLIILTYGINCLVVGNCDTFAWAIVILIIINTALALYSLLNMLLSKKPVSGKRK